MGTPNNSLDFVLEGWRVRGEEFTPEAWCKIILTALDLFRVSLRNISCSGFKPLADFINVRPEVLKPEDAFKTVVTDPDIVVYSSGITSSTRCAFLAQTRECVISEDRKNFEDWHLLVTQKCTLILWNYAWRGHPGTRGKELFNCSFLELSPNDLMALIRDDKIPSHMIWHILPCQIIRSIMKLVNDEVSKRLATIEKAKQPMEQLKLICSRITPNPCA